MPGLAPLQLVIRYDMVCGHFCAGKELILDSVSCLTTPDVACSFNFALADVVCSLQFAVPGVSCGFHFAIEAVFR